MVCRDEYAKERNARRNKEVLGALMRISVESETRKPAGGSESGKCRQEVPADRRGAGEGKQEPRSASLCSG